MLLGVISCLFLLFGDFCLLCVVFVLFSFVFLKYTTVSPVFICCLGPAICPIGDISVYTNNKILRQMFYNLIIMTYNLMTRRGEVQL